MDKTTDTFSYDFLTAADMLGVSSERKSQIAHRALTKRVNSVYGCRRLCPARGETDDDLEHCIMSAVIVIPFGLTLFFLRDYFLLQMGPPRRLAARLRIYALVLLASVVLVSGATLRLSDEELLDAFRVPRLLLPFVGLYPVFVTICLWVKRTERYRGAWLLAAAPNPLLALCTVFLGRLMFSSSWGHYIPTAGSSLVACVWIGLISLSLKGTSDLRMDLPDLSFSIGIAGFVNAIALFLCLPIF